MWLLNTHCHGDHIGGHWHMVERMRPQVAAYALEAPKLLEPGVYAAQTRMRFPDDSSKPQSTLRGVRADRVLSDGEIIAGRLQMVAIPGHADDCVCWFDLQMKTLITGDSLRGTGTICQGIGAAAAAAFAQKGYNVGITRCKNPEGAQKVREECLRAGGSARVYPADLSRREDCLPLMDAFLSDSETIDVLVNNAGGALQIPGGEFEDMPLDYRDSQINLNLNAAAYCSQQAVRNMKEHHICGLFFPSVGTECRKHLCPGIPKRCLRNWP